MASRISGRSGPWSVLASSVLFSASAGAAQFHWGELEGQFDSALSFGTSIATVNPDPALHNSANSDDGRLNFASGDVFSAVFKGTHDLELKHDNLGVFLRGTYWYDTALRDHDQRFKQVEDNNRKRSAKTAGSQLLDAFGYYLYDIDGQPGFSANWPIVIGLEASRTVPSCFSTIPATMPGSGLPIEPGLTSIEA